MSVKIKDNTATITLDFQRNTSLAIRFLLDEIHDKAEPRTPKKIGDLRANVLKTVTGNHGQIKWGQDYATKMETVKAKRYTTPGTGTGYAKDSVTAVVNNPSAAFRKARLI